MRIESLLQHGDADGELAVSPPIYQTTPFPAASAEEFAAMAHQPRHDRFYRRHGNPTQTRLETLVAALEGAEAGLATGSGMGAISTALLALLSRGDHVVAQTSMYGGTLSLLRTLAPRLGVQATLVDQTEPEVFARAIRPETRVIMIETPSNPLLQLTDVAAVVAIASDHGVLTLADNTVATPLTHRPLAGGVDLVVHSVTKALSGHADVLGGIVVGRDDLVDRVWETHIVLGSVISPLDAWLAVRGLRTLPMRVAAQNRTALALARWLEAHPRVLRVNYPGLDSHPQHELARRQMSGFGGLLSFELDGGAAVAERFVSSLRLFTRSASLGGTHSLVVQPAAMWAQDLTPERLAEAGVSPGLIRIAVGLEHEDDLVADLGEALTVSAAAGVSA